MTSSYFDQLMIDWREKKKYSMLPKCRFEGEGEKLSRHYITFLVDNSFLNLFHTDDALEPLKILWELIYEN